MGWCSGTEIFDPMAEAILAVDLSDKTKVQLLIKLIRTLWQNDWDCESDSRFYKDKLVRKALVKLNHYFPEDD